MGSEFSGISKGSPKFKLNRLNRLKIVTNCLQTKREDWLISNSLTLYKFLSLIRWWHKKGQKNPKKCQKRLETQKRQKSKKNTRNFKISKFSKNARFSEKFQIFKKKKPNFWRKKAKLLTTKKARKGKKKNAKTYQKL